jgi:hypothetical protein
MLLNRIEYASEKGWNHGLNDMARIGYTRTESMLRSTQLTNFVSICKLFQVLVVNRYHYQLRNSKNLLQTHLKFLGKFQPVLQVLTLILRT